MLTLLTWKYPSRHNGVHFFHIWKTSGRPKVVRPLCALHIFTSKCALPHNGVHIFDISTSKSGPILVCFCTCSLPNVLCPTTACAFSTFQVPKVVREWCALTLFTSQCASHHNSMQFSICPDVSAPAAKPTFRPSGTTKHWKKQWFGTFLLFRAPASSLF